MELPIDHFRLLGVNPSVDAGDVLRTLQLKIDRSPEDGFTDEALTQRAELLNLSAELLSDSLRRKEYEEALLNGSEGLEISSSREVGGLILLWEGDSALDAFQLCCKSLQPPQAPALGSGRESDLTLLVALSCNAAALQEQEDRRYESAAIILQQGVQLLQRMGKLPEKRKELERELQSLLPYRVLDLLSRDLGDQVSHQEGIRLLDSFVIKRGGLEGTNLSKGKNDVLDQVEFERFFQQIRKFLTVQEQVDVFIGWQRAGSLDSGFLAVLALVADGFSRRKPERIQQGRKRLERINLLDLDLLPLLGCMDLLLGDVDLAQARFFKSKDLDLQNWLKSYQGNTLGAICEYCLDWLRKDVLPGYRDVNSQVVDLDAWFADRDIQKYIENMDKKLGRFQGFAFLQPAPVDAESSDEVEKNSASESIIEKRSTTIPLGVKFLAASQQSFRKLLSVSEIGRLNLSGLINSKIRRDSVIKSPPKTFIRPLLYILFASAAIALTVFRFQPVNRLETSANKSSLRNDLQQSKLQRESLENTLKENPSLDRGISFEPLIADKPTKKELQALLDAWLVTKSVILAGGESVLLPIIARENLVERVYEQRKKDIKANETISIEATINTLKIVSRKAARIELKAKLVYRDMRLNASGEKISETYLPKLFVTYILGRDGKTWKLHEYISGTS